MKRAYYQNDIFGHIIKLSNTLQVYLDHHLSDDHMTSKQLFLMMVVSSYGAQAPSFREAAERFGCSYQNIKQLALKMSKEGYLDIVGDEKDKRIKRLILTDQSREYWSKRDEKDSEALSQLFSEFSVEELNIFLSMLKRILDKLEEGKNG